MKRTLSGLALILSPAALGGCLSTAVAVVGETVEAGVEITGAAAGAVVDAAIPDGDEEDDKD